MDYPYSECAGAPDGAPAPRAASGCFRHGNDGKGCVSVFQGTLGLDKKLTQKGLPIHDTVT